jgi:hypothetical protein
MKIRVIQTADATSGYKGLMDVTKEVNELYCKKWEYDYQAFIGMKRGYHSWNATFNRIYLMEEALTDSTIDWVVYLDADCFVKDLNTRFEEIIYEDGPSGNNSEKAFIFCRGSSDELYDINAGVFFMNVRHPGAAAIINIWKTYYETVITDQILYKASAPWSISCRSLCIQDQSLLEYVFRMYHTMGVLDKYLHTYNGDRGNRFNYNGPFIRQLIRPHMGSKGPCIEERIIDARIQVDEVLKLLYNNVASIVQTIPTVPVVPVVSTIPIVPVVPIKINNEDSHMVLATGNSSSDVTQCVMMNCGGFISSGVFSPNA